MKTETQVLAEAKSLASIPTFNIDNISPKQLQLIKNTVAKGATDDELNFFLYQCDKFNLDPLKKEIWFIKRVKKVNQNGFWDYPRLANGEINYEGGELVIMTSKDGYFKKAAENPNFKGCQAMEVRENDDFEMDFDGEKFSVKKHKFSAKDRGEILGAWACVTYKDGVKEWNYVSFEEYCQTSGKEGNKYATGSWKSHPTAMIKKTAEVPLLKRAGGLSGIYTEEEMQNVIDVDAIDNSPVKADVRENEIEKIIKKIEDVKTLEEWKVVAAEISDVSGGFMKEEITRIRAVAAKKVESLQEKKLDEVAKASEKKLEAQTTLPGSDGK